MLGAFGLLSKLITIVHMCHTIFCLLCFQFSDRAVLCQLISVYSFYFFRTFLYYLTLSRVRAELHRGAHNAGFCFMDLYLIMIKSLLYILGSSKCALFPTSHEEVSQILQHCYSRRLAVVPQSGNTGLVGGSVPVYDEVIVSLRKLNKRFSFNSHSGTTRH